MSFAKHQTFHIRDGWLRKGMVAVKNDRGIFLSEKAPEQLGLGVNMVRALRFWMVATGLTEEEYENRRRVQHLTPFGKRVLEYDEYLEEDGTLWLIHYHLAKNPAEATTWYWFFNHFAKLVFDKEQFVSELDFWIRQTESKEVSRRSLERDFNCFLKTYLPSDRALSPEDTIECPLSALELLSADNTKDKISSASHPSNLKGKTYRFLKPSVARFHPLIALYVISSLGEVRYFRIRMAMQIDAKNLLFLIQPAPRFQRAINLKYDISASDTIASFIPTPNAADAIKELLWATEEGAVQRAFVLVGAYGAGKSLLGVVLAAFLSGNVSLCPALEVVIGRLKQDFPEVGELGEEYLQERQKLLPVILSGDEGDLNSALGRALNRALQRVGLNDVKPTTFYKAALDTISLWEKEYPEVFNRLEAALKERHGVDVSKFKSALESHQPEAYYKFVALYPRLAAGASFDAYHGQSIIDAYAKTAEEIRQHGYSGIIVLYDEFGRYLESKAGEPFGQEAKLLQDFAEHCNRSGENQLHLVLITHQSLMQYAYGLPEAFQQEWGKIEGRFRSLPVSSSPDVSLKLIAEALQFPDKGKWESFKAKHQAKFDELFLHAVDAKLFEHLSDAEIRTNVIEGAYPLHPVTVYCLPRLSEKVAQNERTLFTFLASDEPHALGEFLSNTSTETSETQTRSGCKDELPLVHLDRLYDYFEIPIKTNTIPGGTHGVWSDVQNALKKCGGFGERFSNKSLFRCFYCGYVANADFNASVNLHKVFWDTFPLPKRRKKLKKPTRKGKVAHIAPHLSVGVLN